MQQRKLVNELNNIHQDRQFMAFKGYEVIIVKQQHPTIFSFINLEVSEHSQNIELNYKNAFEIN